MSGQYPQLEVVDLGASPIELLTATLPELMEKQFPPPYYIVPGILPEGCALLGGKAKKGKSWFALGVALAAAFGGIALSQISVDRNGVLYLALEDSEELLQERCRLLLGDQAPPPNFHYATVSPTLDVDGLTVLEDWLKAHPETRFVVIDTLKRIKPRSRGRNAYDEDYEALAPITDLAHRHRLSFLALHHLKKEPTEDDPFDELSGSAGVQAAADTLMILRGARGNADAILHVAGRRLKYERKLALSLDPESGVWKLLGEAAEVVLPHEQQRVVEALRYADEPLQPKDVAALIDKHPAAVRVLMHRMVKSGQIEAPINGFYRAPPVEVKPLHDVTLCNGDVTPENDAEASTGAKNDPSVTPLHGFEEPDVTLPVADMAEMADFQTPSGKTNTAKSANPARLLGDEGQEETF